MNATPTGPEAPTGLPRRSLAALIGAAVALVAVVAFVLLFGVARPPEVTPLADDPTPAPPGGIAWTSWDDGEGCLHVASPDGARREVRCSRDGGDEILGWDEDGIVLLEGGPAQELVVVDPVTGDVEERRDAADDREPRQLSTGRIDSHYEDGVLTVRHGDEDVVLWAVEAPENYRVDQGAVSPDGQWAVLLDSVGRILLVPADGSAAPRLWAETDARWRSPVWEGTPVEITTG